MCKFFFTSNYNYNAVDGRSCNMYFKIDTSNLPSKIAFKSIWNNSILPQLVFVTKIQLRLTQQAKNNINRSM